MDVKEPDKRPTRKRPSANLCRLVAAFGVACEQCGGDDGPRRSDAAKANAAEDALLTALAELEEGKAGAERDLAELKASTIHLATVAGDGHNADAARIAELERGRAADAARIEDLERQLSDARIAASYLVAP